MSGFDLEKGDVVQLNSGGPHMTISWVQEITHDVYIHTKWFDNHGVCNEGRFPEAMIKFID